MKEDFLHYLWSYQIFSKNNLKSTSGELIEIIKTGLHNQNSGPDFLQSQVVIAGQKWAGNIEIHLKSSDWYVHAHEQDAVYDNVILHVVWEDDVAVFRNNKTLISTLELKGLVPKSMLDNYRLLLHNNRHWLACEVSLQQDESFEWVNWLERLYIERLESRYLYIQELLEKSNNDWENVLYQVLLKSFGYKVNASAFTEIANKLSYTLIRKHSNSLIDVEALLFGQAGLLGDDVEDAYFKDLVDKYDYFTHKYGLPSPAEKVRFFRLRPPNFPTIRLSQFADLLVNKSQLFMRLMETKQLEDFYELLKSKTSSYWETHYTFGKTGVKRKKQVSKSFIDLLLINAIIPLQFAYQKHIGQQDIEKILKILKQIKPEKNGVIESFKKNSVSVQNAMDTQALIELQSKYCKPQRCLKCRLGLHILKK